MRQLIDTKVVAVILVMAGLVIVGLVQGRSQLKSEQHKAIPVAIVIPTALAAFPDIEHVPVYPNPAITFADSGTANKRHITYEVPDHIDKVAKFYQVMLPNQGWILRSESGQRSRYSWINREEKALWHMYLDVTIGLTFDNDKTVVYLEYGRYPNIDEGVRLYPDAQQAEVTRSDIEKRFASGKTPVHITEITYLSSAGAPEIADFYTNSMQEYGWSLRESGWSTDEYGWFPFDSPGSWGADKQGGDISSQEGLYFVAVRPSWDIGPSVVSYHLLATATIQEGGWIVIKLHIEEFETTTKL
jgi:hypothetical protein